MAKLDIITVPDPRLQIVSQVVATVDDKIRRLLDDMLETMYAAPGIGLAAIQVAMPKRLLVIDVAKREGKEHREPRFFVNPEIIWKSDELSALDEGCLSVPEYRASIKRATRIRVRFLDYEGALQEIEAGGILATCLQHEIDHLDGITIGDRAPLFLAPT